MEQPLLSVVIPVHNVAAYIDRNLNSVVTQTYTNLEIIIVDDGSEDQTGPIIDGWAKKDARIKVIHLTQNLGISRARNVGLTNAQGTYVTFLDGDDWCEPQLCAFYVTHMQRYQLDLMSCGYYIDPKGALSDTQSVGDQWLSQRKLIRLVRKMNSPIRGYNWNKCYRLDIIRKYQLYFNESLILMEDQVFNVAYILKSKRYMYNSQPLYHYCQRTGSTIHQPSLRKGKDVVVAITAIQSQIWYQDLTKVGQRAATVKKQLATTGHLKRDRRQN